MIAEPYICIKGPIGGRIAWLKEGQKFIDPNEVWMPYASFEREKLRDLASIDKRIRVSDTQYELRLPSRTYTWSLLGLATEASLLLSRAAFLHDICEKEGVAWLPQDRVVAKVKLNRPIEGVDVVKELTDCDIPEGCVEQTGPIIDPTPREFYTKAEVDAHFTALLNLLAIPNCGILDGVRMKEEQFFEQWDELVRRFWPKGTKDA